MRVIKISDVKVEEATGEFFKGRVYRQPLVDTRMAKELRVIVVTFDPGARNVFHTHTNEQVLYVIDGKGIVATETEEQVVTPGTLIFIPAGELHWHGATKDSHFAHISIATPGQTKVGKSKEGA